MTSIRQKFEEFMRWLSERGPWAYSWGDEATCNLLHPSMHGEIKSFELREDFKENEKGISWAHPRMELEVRIFINSLRCWSLVTPWSSFLSLLSHLLSCSSSFLILHLRERESMSEWGMRESIGEGWFSIWESSFEANKLGQGEGERDSSSKLILLIKCFGGRSVRTLDCPTGH